MLSLLLTLSIALSCAHLPQDPSPPVATLDGEPLPLDDLAGWMVLQRGRAALDGYLVRLLVERETAAAEARVDEGSVERALEEEIEARVQGAFGGDRERWRAELRRLGGSEAAYRARRRSELSTELAAARLLAGRRSVEPGELQRLFERRYGPDGRRLWLRTIRLRLSMPPLGKVDMAERQRRTRQLREELEGRLAALRERILTGEDFATLAREHSDDEDSAARGGELAEPFDGSRWPAPFVNAIRQLEEGAISPPLYGQGSFGIYQIVREERTRLEEVADELERELRERPPSASEMGELVTGLRADAEVEELPTLYRPGPAEEPVALLDGRPITRGEVGRWLVLQSGASYLESYVQERLVRRAAAGLGIEVTPEEVAARVDAELEQVIAVTFRGDRDAWRADVERRGGSPEQLRRERAVRAEVDLLVDRLVLREREVSDEDVRRRWEEVYGPDGRGIEVRLVRRTLALPPEAQGLAGRELEELEAELRARAVSDLEDLARRVRAGEDPATLAQLESDDPATRAAGGRYPGRFPLESWPEPARRALADLAAGELSEPVVLEPYVFLFQVLSVDEVPLEQVAADLRAELAARPPSVPERSSFMNGLLARHELELHPENLVPAADRASEVR